MAQGYGSFHNPLDVGSLNRMIVRQNRYLVYNVVVGSQIKWFSTADIALLIREMISWGSTVYKRSFPTHNFI